MKQNELVSHLYSLTDPSKVIFSVTLQDVHLAITRRMGDHALSSEELELAGEEVKEAINQSGYSRVYRNRSGCLGDYPQAVPVIPDASTPIPNSIVANVNRSCCLPCQQPMRCNRIGRSRTCLGVSDRQRGQRGWPLGRNHYS